MSNCYDSYQDLFVKVERLTRENEALRAAAEDCLSALEYLGADGWSEAPHLMGVIRAALEQK